MFLSCNSSGATTKDGQVAKSDGTIIDLDKITKNIKDSVDFAKSVKEVHTLVKSIDELAKAIGKKIQNQDTLADEANQNGSLLAGVFQVMVDVKVKLEALEQIAGISEELKGKITDSKLKTIAFSKKLKDNHAQLGVAAAQSDDAKKAIDRVNKVDGENGAKELGELNKAIDALLKDAEAAVTSAINALTTSTKPSNT
ncbi:Vsp/OspC family lipoprotein [Borrelia puertoricensis]|uniref:Vsp/OspC family lipoprotein n=1 Tax=Borrelia puertoricensis TaxID=2756107 RepID=UPI003EB929D4